MIIICKINLTYYLKEKNNFWLIPGQFLIIPVKRKRTSLACGDVFAQGFDVGAEGLGAL